MARPSSASCPRPPPARSRSSSSATAPRTSPLSKKPIQPWGDLRQRAAQDRLRQDPEVHPPQRRPEPHRSVRNPFKHGVTFVSELPKTATGKIQKFILRNGAPNLTAQ